jgi:hypothetical protein
MMENSKYIVSDEVYSSFLDLGNIPETNCGIISSDYLQVFANSGFKDSETNPITFNIQAVQSIYSDLSESFVYLRLKVVLNDGKNTQISSDDTVALVESFFGSLLENVQVVLNDTPISRNSRGLYAYRNFFIIC